MVFHPSSQIIYQKCGLIWRVWKRETSRGRMGQRSKFKYLTQSTRLPRSSRKATVNLWSKSRITYTGSAHSSYDRNITTHSNSLEHHHSPLDISQEDDDIPIIIDSLRNNRLYVVCDGSFLPARQVGAAAWVMQSFDKSARISGAKKNIGSPSQQNACRSEIVAQSALLQRKSSPSI